MDQTSLGESSRRFLQAAALALLLLVLYVCFPTRNHYWDGIGFSLNIEGVPHSGVTFDPSSQPVRHPAALYYNPNHLLYNLAGYLIYKPLGVLFPNLRALDVLRAMSIFSSLATACLLWSILYRWSRDARLSVCLTLLMAFSATWWKYSTDANAYLPATFLLVLATFLLTRLRRPSVALWIGLLHAFSMLLHQIAVFFFPAVVIALWCHPLCTPPRQRRTAIFVYTLAAAIPVAAAYAWVWLEVLDGPWAPSAFLAWLTFNGADTFAFRSLPSSVLQALRSLLRVFFGGRISLALNHVEAPLLLALVAVMLGALIRAGLGARQLLRARLLSRTGHKPAEIPTRWITFLASWVIAFSLFLFLWLAEYPYYRLFFLPPLILLAGASLMRRFPDPIARASVPLPALVVFMAAFNFTFYIYPYSKTEATPPVHLAAGAAARWKHDVVILYKEFTCDNWIMRYFNPHTTWKRADFSDSESLTHFLHQTFGEGRSLWVDTTILGHLDAFPEARQWLEGHAIVSGAWGISNRKHHIQFAQLVPRPPD